MLHEIESEITKLERVADVLRGLTSNGAAPKGKRQGMSAAGRRKISLAQKARWAKRGASNQVLNMKPKRTLSATARRKIAAAQRLRWAKFKASQKKTA
jgi:hypothetical protein